MKKSKHLLRFLAQFSLLSCAGCTVIFYSTGDFHQANNAQDLVKIQVAPQVVTKAEVSSQTPVSTKGQKEQNVTAHQPVNQAPAPETPGFIDKITEGAHTVFDKAKNIAGKAKNYIHFW